MVARRAAAGDLQIDDAGIDAVAADDLAHDDFERRVADRRRDAQLGERAVQPV